MRYEDARELLTNVDVDAFVHQLNLYDGVDVVREEAEEILGWLADQLVDEDEPTDSDSEAGDASAN